MCCKENKCFAAFVLVGIYAPTRILLYIEGYSFGKTTKEGGFMVIKIDFQSEEALYMQLRNQIILGRKGAVIALDVDKMEAINEIKKNLRVILAKAHCKNISADEVHELVDEIFSEYEPL